MNKIGSNRRLSGLMGQLPPSQAFLKNQKSAIDFGKSCEGCAMGGYGSGRRGGRPNADESLFVDIAWMVRTKRAVPGQWLRGTLSWSCRGEPSGSVSYEADMRDPYASKLKLNFTRGSGENKESVEQLIPLTFTEPNYGGKRWWMICPYRHIRVGKLFFPHGGDRFASRKAWGLGYFIQTRAKRDKPFEALFRLQKRLGCTQGWEAGLFRPKGMWKRTFERHFDRYLELDALCSIEMISAISRIWSPSKSPDL
jgi:hypothetical protein